MTSSAAMANPVETLAKDVRRSRFSFHLNTAHRRRWLLVQLVSMPVNQAEDDTQAQRVHLAQTQAHRPQQWRQFVDDYRSTQILRMPT